jgi:hypothetical protein
VRESLADVLARADAAPCVWRAAHLVQKMKTELGLPANAPAAAPVPASTTGVNLSPAGALDAKRRRARAADDDFDSVLAEVMSDTRHVSAHSTPARPAGTTTISGAHTRGLCDCPSEWICSDKDLDDELNASFEELGIHFEKSAT